MRIALLVAASVFPFCLPQPASAQGCAKATKLIEWGWDEPDPKFMRQNVQRMEQLPFDGVIFHVTSSKGGSLSWEMWGLRKFELAEFRQEIDDLKATPFRRLTERFLRVNVTPGNVDWFDDQAWAVVTHNVGVAAQIAKEGGCRGFMFDVEQYNDHLFKYDEQKHRTSKTFAEYQAKVRQRGREWMEAVNGPFPDITLLLTFAYSIYSTTGGQPQERAKASYGLLGDFLDGMLDACTPQTRIVDGWERAYRYKKKEQFQQAYETTKGTLAAMAADPERCRRRIEVGFGIWMDSNWSKIGWHTDDPSKNFFKPAEFETSVRLALQASDEYVWIYTEQPRWWTNEKLPQAYVDALRTAREETKSPKQPGRISPGRPCRKRGRTGNCFRDHLPLTDMGAVMSRTNKCQNASRSISRSTSIFCVPSGKSLGRPKSRRWQPR